MNGIQAIVFDLGNVLIDFDHRIAAAKIQGFTDRNAKEVFEFFFDSEATALFEEGKISPAGFFDKVKGALNLKINYEQFLPIWNEIFFLTPKNYYTLSLAERLKNRHKLAVLSNINTLHLEYIKNNYPIFTAFGDIIASCAVGARKPDPKIYQTTLNLLGVPPEGVFYTDDRPELIQAAKRLGINSFVFSGADKLAHDLESLGVNIN